MTDYSFLMRTTPSGERCAQVGDENYLKISRIEALAYINQLDRVYGSPPCGCYFRLVKCPNEFGEYRDIKFYYDPQKQSHISFLELIEQGCLTWDHEAFDEVNIARYSCR